MVVMVVQIMTAVDDMKTVEAILVVVMLVVMVVVVDVGWWWWWVNLLIDTMTSRSLTLNRRI